MYMLCVYYYLAILENARKMEILDNCLFNSGYFFFHPEVPRTVLLYILTIINGVCNVMIYVMLGPLMVTGSSLEAAESCRSRARNVIFSIHEILITVPT
jgi:hypothetical protein